MPAGMFSAPGMVQRGPGMAPAPTPSLTPVRSKVKPTDQASGSGTTQPAGAGPLAGLTGQTPGSPTGNFWSGGSTTAPTTDNGSTEQNLSTTGRESHATLQAGQEAGQDRNQFESMLGGGQDAIDTYMKGALSAAMPSFNAQLEQVQEQAQKRGISTGDLGTSYEGDLASAFQQNFANAAAQQSMNLYGTQLGATQKQGMFDTENYESGLGNAQNIAQATKNKKNAIFGSIGGTVGGLLGGAVGGPGGAAAGGSVGGALGSLWS